jgi:hypothetical protein
VALEEREGLVFLEAGILIELGDAEVAADAKGSMMFHTGYDDRAGAPSTQGFKVGKLVLGALLACRNPEYRAALVVMGLSRAVLAVAEPPRRLAIAATDRSDHARSNVWAGGGRAVSHHYEDPDRG